jgi:hypothetical protein
MPPNQKLIELTKKLIEIRIQLMNQLARGI